MDGDAKEAAMGEIKMHKRLVHPNIIKLLDCYKTNKEKIIMITQYAEKLDMMHEIQKRIDNDYKYYTEEEILHYFSQICLAVKYIHDRQL